MTKKLLPLVIMTLLSATSYAATPPDTLVVAQGLDDIVSLCYIWKTPNIT